MALKQYLPSVTPLRGCLTAKMNNYWLCEQSDNYVPLRDISKVVVDAIVLSEDGSFFDHQGFDWYEIQKSLQKNMTAMKYARGASTITQQLAKNVFLSPEKSMLRKLREAYLTVELEKQFSKSIILEKYLNVIEFGPNIYGVKAGAKYYFAKAPSEVNLVEAAFLAFVLPNPKEYQKSFEKKDLTEFARKRLQQIIRTMFRFGRISGEDRDAAAEYLGVVGWIDEKSEETNEQINDQLNTLEEALQVPVDEPEQLPEQVPEPFEVEEEHSD
ncbi:MAG: transglycosylase domain-containing protein [Pseudomonadota bacterium]|nr:transglycosylase domain-containing protein [Pseudomonadota bacterium]